MTILTRLSFKQQQMPDEISYKQSRKYSTKPQALIAIFFVICLLIYAIPKHNPRFVNSTFEVEITKEVSTSKVKLYGLKPQRLAASVKVKPKKAKPKHVEPKQVKSEKSKTEQDKLETSKPEKVKPEKPTLISVINMEVKINMGGCKKCKITKCGGGKKHHCLS